MEIAVYHHLLQLLSLGSCLFIIPNPTVLLVFPLLLRRAMAYLWSGPFLKNLNLNLGYPSSVLTSQLYLECSSAKSKRIMLKHHTSVDVFKKQPSHLIFLGLLTCLECSAAGNVLDRGTCPMALPWWEQGILQEELCKHNPVFVPQGLVDRVICCGKVPDLS